MQLPSLRYSAVLVAVSLFGLLVYVRLRHSIDSGDGRRFSSNCRAGERCCCLPWRPESSLAPSTAGGSIVASGSGDTSTVRVQQPSFTYPDCPDAAETASNGGATAQTAGGCRLDEVHQFLYGHGPQDRAPSEQLSLCDAAPLTLVGAIRVFRCQACMRQLDRLNFYLGPGGSYEPRHCTARGRAAVVIPFRNRWQHLSEFMLNVHPLLQKQELAYTIFVVNQREGSKFNRGMLMNIGAMEASKLGNYTCFIFHDVDLLPENDKNLYRCPDGFHHYSVAIDKFNYKLPYEFIVGGVLAADKKSFEKINGYSNLYFGWGGEDDDLSGRITSNGYRIQRFNPDVSRYQMIKHNGDTGNEANPNRFELLKSTSSRSQTDGLNALVYKVDAITQYKLFTMVDVTINQQEVMNKFSGVAAKSTRRR